MKFVKIEQIFSEMEKKYLKTTDAFIIDMKMINLFFRKVN